MNEKQVLEMLVAAMQGNGKVKVAEVERFGDKIILPNGMQTKNAIDILTAKMKQEEEYTIFTSTLPLNPYDGAYIIGLAAEALFGVVVMESRGGRPPVSLEVPIDHEGHTVKVPWGAFRVPNVEGTISTSYSWDGDRVVSSIVAEVKGKHSEQMQALFDMARELAKTHSIYKGKAIAVKFTNDSGEQLPLPEIKFLNLNAAQPPIFSADVEEKLQHDLYAYVTLPTETIMDIAGQLTRGVLLAGKYGTGKTMLAAHLGRLAVANGFTFTLCEPQDAIEAIKFGHQYGPSFNFVEDVDKLDANQQRELMNALDGIQSKDMRVITVFTTNHHEKVNRGLLRHGRIDLALEIGYPDAAAAMRIARHYAGQHIANEDFTQAAQLLGGNTPPAIREAVKRAMVRAAARDPRNYAITCADLISAAKSVLNERAFLEEPYVPQLGDREKAATVYAESLATALSRTAALG